MPKPGKILRTIPLYVWVLIGLLAGILWGWLALHYGWTEFSERWIIPWGTLFLRLLQMMAVPIILVSLIKGVGALEDLRSLSRVGSLTFTYYLSTTALAIAIGLALGTWLQPGKLFSEAQRIEFQHKYADQVSTKLAQAQEQDRSILQLLVEMVPSNPFDAFTDNRRMLQVIVFAILLGMGLVAIPRTKRIPVLQVVEGLEEALLWLVQKILLLAPPGVFGLMVQVMFDTGGENLRSTLAALSAYAGTVILGLCIMLLLVYPVLVGVLTGWHPFRFLRSILPAQLVAFSTSSSAATLPVSLRVARSRLGISDSVSGFVLPLGATINMDGTALYQGVATLFIAQAMNIDLTLTQKLEILLMAVLASVGAAAIPGAGMIMLLVILQSVGIAPEGIALILAVDRPLDMLRTTVNVTSDLTATTLVHHFVHRRKRSHGQNLSGYRSRPGRLT